MRDPHTIAAIAAAAYAVITFLVARRVTWWWAIDIDGLDDRDLGERAAAAFVALAASPIERRERWLSR